jgi:hypothetical protein
LAGREASEFLLAEQLESEVQQVVETRVIEEMEAQGLVAGEEGTTKAITDGASTFTDSNSTQVVLVDQNGSGLGLKAQAASNHAILGVAEATSGAVFGVRGETPSTSGRGLYGIATASSGATFGVQGVTNSTSGTGVIGTAQAGSGTTRGVSGVVSSPEGIGIIGENISTSGPTVGIWGISRSVSGTGVRGEISQSTGTNAGVHGKVNSPEGTAGLFDTVNTGGKLIRGRSGAGLTEVFTVDGSGFVTAGGLTVDSPTLMVDAANNRVGIGQATPSTTLHVGDSINNARIDLGSGGPGQAHVEWTGGFLMNIGEFDWDVFGLFVDDAINPDVGQDRTHTRIGSTLEVGSGGTSGNDVTVNNGDVTLTNGNLVVTGDLSVTGALSKGSGTFKIDHPLDPANKYLYHSFVESPDMKNVYDGVAVFNSGGEAVVELPQWFEALNSDFRYQLTCIGGFAPVYIAAEIDNNSFKIAGGQPGMKISWQVTGIRRDAYARDHRTPVEEAKPQDEQGYYLYPEGFGQPAQRGVSWARRLAQSEAGRGRAVVPLDPAERTQARARRRLSSSQQPSTGPADEHK